MRRRERWNVMLEMLAGDGRVDIDDAAERLSVSAATIRRDLDELADQRLLVRTRGGAVPHSVSYDLPLRYKMSRHLDEKRRIAAVAADLVVPGGVVGLNGGTTTTEVARALAGRTDLQLAGTERGGPFELDAPRVTVVTNALNIAHELAVRPHVKIVVTGGVARPQSYELVGPLALPAIDQLTLDLAVLGVDGISARAGACTSSEDEAAVNQAMARRARKLVVVGDTTKLGHHAFARICDAESIDMLITGEAADATTVAEMRDAGVEVVLA